MEETFEEFFHTQFYYAGYNEQTLLEENFDEMSEIHWENRFYPYFLQWF